MKALRRFLSRLSGSTTSRHDEARLKEELEAHLQMQAAENVRAGLPPEEARRQAVLKFGPIEAIKGSYRDEQRLPVVDDFLQDVRYACRQLRKAPLFTLTAILSLAMGIGANAAVFTVVERVLLRPLPVSKPHELVYMADERILTQSSPRFSYPLYAVLRATNVLDGVAARFALGLNASVNGQTVRVSGELVSGNYFSVFGAGTVTGRPLSPEDDRTPGAHPVAVISEPFWRRMFASDPAVAGRSVRLNDQAFTILGVAANGFTGPSSSEPTDIWIPLAMQREFGRNLLTDARTNWLEIVGRLRPGLSREQAAEALNGRFRQRASELPSDAVGEVAGPAAEQLARAWGAGIRPHRALCAERAGPGARLRQCGLPGRGAVGRPRRRKSRYAWPSAPAVHACSGNCSPKASCWRRSGASPAH